MANFSFQDQPEIFTDRSTCTCKKKSIITQIQINNNYICVIIFLCKFTQQDRKILRSKIQIFTIEYEKCITNLQFTCTKKYKKDGLGRNQHVHVHVYVYETEDQYIDVYLIDTKLYLTSLFLTLSFSTAALSPGSITMLLSSQYVPGLVSMESIWVVPPAAVRQYLRLVC